MSDNHAANHDEFQALWAELPSAPRVTSAQMRAYAQSVASGLRRRAIVAAVIIVLGIGNAVLSTLLQPRPMATWKWVVVIGLLGWAVVMLWITRASRRQSTPALDSAESVRSYRSMLEKERDMNRGRLLAPRIVIPLIGGVVASVGLSRVNGLSVPGVALVAALVGVATGWIWLSSVRRARMFQAHIDVLDRSLSN